MQIDSFERSLLRERALDRWQQSKVLRHDAESAERRLEDRVRGEELRTQARELRGRTEELRGRTEELRGRTEETLARAARLVEDNAILRSGSFNPTTLEVLTDRAIRGWRASHHNADDADDAAALVASSSMSKLIRIKELLALRSPYVAGATDAGTALGLAIVTQPDVAVIDARLELASGVDFALTLPLYAPQTKALVLTDDPERARELRIVGFDTAGTQVADATVLDWIERAA